MQHWQPSDHMHESELCSARIVDWPFARNSYRLLTILRLSHMHAYLTWQLGIPNNHTEEFSMILNPICMHRLILSNRSEKLDQVPLRDPLSQFGSLSLYRSRWAGWSSIYRFRFDRYRVEALRRKNPMAIPFTQPSAQQAGERQGQRASGALPAIFTHPPSLQSILIHDWDTHCINNWCGASLDISV